MSKVGRISNPVAGKGKRIDIPQNVLEFVDYNDLSPAFSFEYVQSDYCLSKWDKERIKRLIEELGKLEKHKWKDIIVNHLFHLKAVDKKGLKVKIPKFITPDVTIYYIKPFGTDTKYRVFGIRDRHNFKFLWFDNKHEIYP